MCIYTYVIHDGGQHMGKRALITGASSGIGQEFARQLAADGWSITGVARSVRKLEEYLAKLPGTGHRALGADLGTREGVEATVAEINATRYDLFVNNAGIAVVGPFTETPLEEIKKMMRLNVEALYELAHAYLRGARSGDALI